MLVCSLLSKDSGWVEDALQIVIAGLIVLAVQNGLEARCDAVTFLRDGPGRHSRTVVWNAIPALEVGVVVGLIDW